MADDDIDDEGGETVVVDRAAAAEDKTVVIDREEENDRTVVVERAKHAAPADEPEEGTVVVDRRPRRPRRSTAPLPPEPLDPSDADGDDEDRTVVVDREDKTVVVERSRRGRRPKDEAAPAPDSVINLLPTRRGIKVAPVEPGFGRDAVEAIGPNAVETYVPREIASAPEAAPAVPRGDEALRAEAPSMPSVTRRSRTAGAVALLAFAGACVVSLIGIIVVIVWFVRS